MFLILPEGLIYAIMIHMSRKFTQSIEIEESGDGIIRRLQCPGEQLLVVSRKDETDIPLKSSDIVKIAHDLRASLNIIIGYAELMQDEVPGKINEEQRCSLSDILKYSQRMLNLVNDIYRDYKPSRSKNIQ